MAAKTVAEAKEAALEQLGVAEGDAEIHVLDEPRAGLFGRVRGEARVRARVLPIGPRPKRVRRPRDRNERSRPGSGRNGQGRSGRNGEANGHREAQPAAGSDENGSGQRATNGTSAGQGLSRSAKRRRARARARSAAGTAGSTDEAARENGAGDDRGERVGNREDTMAEGMTLEEQGDAARQFVEGLIEELGLEAQVATRIVDEETVEVAATGEGLGILVGPKGSTLAALQDVTRTVVQRQFTSRTDRILVDVAGYRERRAAALQRFSQEVAADVLETKSERALEPMGPADRKVVHDTVNALEGLTTRSEGEEPRRYIVIAPQADD